MKQFHLLLAILFCTFLVPSIAMACGHASDKEVRKQMHCSMKEEQKSCCSSETESNNDEKSCSSSCGNSCCTCTAISSSTSFTLVSEIIFESTNTQFATFKDTQFFYVSKSTTDGFLSVWLIPKIG